jgi:hypothetical protein
VLLRLKRQQTVTSEVRESPEIYLRRRCRVTGGVIFGFALIERSNKYGILVINSILIFMHGKRHWTLLLL